MEYMGDKNYWDEKFLKRSDETLSPEKSLVENIKIFKKGSVLDLACGDGRNSLFMIENGFTVTGVDFSIEGLKRLEGFAKKKGLNIKTKQLDLNNLNEFKDIGVFDNIIINHYRLNKTLVNNLSYHICKNGILFVCGFGWNHKIDLKIRMEDLIQKSDFNGLDKDFDLISFKEENDDRGSFVTFIFKKK